MIIGKGRLQAIQSVSRDHVIINLPIALFLILHRHHRSLYPCLVFVVELVLAVAATRTNPDAHVIQIEIVIDVIESVGTSELQLGVDLETILCKSVETGVGLPSLAVIVVLNEVLDWNHIH